MRSFPASSSVLFVILFFFLTSCNSNQIINGSPAPEISAPGRDGQLIQLASLRGNIVLLHFWASWCKPCREESPKVVAIYDKYRNASFKKSGGFTVLSVSLDSEKSKWMQAIEKDNLHWEHHACDLLGWKSAAVDSFGVSSIPASFLIDQNGVVIGKNMKPKELDKLLRMLIVE